MRWWLCLVVIIITLPHPGESRITKTTVESGQSVSLELPAFKTCGQYFLLDPSLELVLIHSGPNSSNTFGQYIERTRVNYSTSGSVTLTFGKTTSDDQGVYKLAASTKQTCQNISYEITVKGKEQLGPWSEWSDCVLDCDLESTRFRSRKCSVSGGCAGLGPVADQDSCDRAAHCPHWTSWGQYGSCSAKCGKGFRIRRRICLAGNATLLENSACQGHATEGMLCMMVCEVVRAWSGWSEWGRCSETCGVGTKLRTRICGEDPRATSSECSGNSTELTECRPVSCLSSKSTTPTQRSLTIPPLVTTYKVPTRPGITPTMFPTRPGITPTMFPTRHDHTPTMYDADDKQLSHQSDTSPVWEYTSVLPTDQLPTVVMVTEKTHLALVGLAGIGVLVLGILIIIVVCIRQRKTRRQQSSVAATDTRGVTKKHKEARVKIVEPPPRRPSEVSNVYSEMDQKAATTQPEPDVGKRTGSGSDNKLPTNSVIMHMIEEEMLDQSFSSGYVDSDFDDVTEEYGRESKAVDVVDVGVSNVNDDDVEYYSPPAYDADAETRTGFDNTENRARVNGVSGDTVNDDSDIYSIPPDENDVTDDVNNTVPSNKDVTSAEERDARASLTSAASPRKSPKLSYLDGDLQEFHETLNEMFDTAWSGSRDSTYSNVAPRVDTARKQDLNTNATDTADDDVFHDDDHIYSNN